MAEGIVFLVGAGPGDPGLLTLRGKELLETADCVVYDKLVDSRLLQYTPTDCERIYVGKEAANAHHCTPQVTINSLLVEKAKAGKRVVRLKGGDPLLFARGAEEAEALAAAGVRFEVIPGVTAALGAAATAAIPLTHRELSSAVAFVTGHEDPAKENCLDWGALARFPGTLVVYMGLTRMPGIAKRLLENGKGAETPVAFIEWGGCNRQHVVTTTLGLAANGSPAGLKSPVLAVIGKVVGLRERLSWFEERPLFGQRVLVTSPSDSARRLSQQLESVGAWVTVESAIRIEPPESYERVDRALSNLEAFDWLVFSSRPGVEYFFGRLLQLGFDMRKLGRLRLAAIGPGTAAALQAFHLNADLVPSEFRAEALAESLGADAAGKRVLLIRASRGREVLAADLVRFGATVETVVTYRQSDNSSPSPRVAESLRNREFDWILFSSSNIARSFDRWLDPAMKEAVQQGMKILSISPVTSSVVRELGFEVAAEAKRFTLDGMVEALVSAVAAQRSKLAPRFDPLPKDQPS